MRQSTRIAGSVWLLFYMALAGPVRAADAPFAGPLSWPLDGDARPLRGGFGEPRSNHFHAGLDLSTGGHTGARVLAPAASTLERVRTSGVGFGRAVYLHTADDRLIVYGHLDAFEPVLAAWVDSTQRASGQYDQDLFPPAGLFRYAAGEQVAWSGESGAGPPHLHVEVRHGDFALNPLLAGLAVPDTVPPVITRLVLEPLDEHAFVERGAAPYTYAFAPRAKPGVAEDTLVVEGRVRLTLAASDATNEAVRQPVRIVGARWNGEWVECRMDSVSWAGEMSQTLWLLDSGRVTGSEGVILDAPAGIRPRFLASSRPDSLAIELVRVIDGAAARPLDLYARDAAGNASTRRVWLRGPQWNELGPDTTRVARMAVRKPARKRAAAAPAAEPAWE
ncbi:MAG: M23 family metallopeptidase, partial [Candidatus Eisenbacteria bacterium]